MVPWIGKDSTSFLLALGAIQSPLLKLQLRGITSCCPSCNEVANPSWSHIWNCAVGIDPDSDVMLERFLWPASGRDLRLCDRFLRGIRSFV